MFKGLTPRGFRPEPWLIRFCRAVHSKSLLDLNISSTQLTYLRNAESSAVLKRDEEFAHWCRSQLEAKRPILAIMPSSIWPGKCWPSNRYVELLRLLRKSRADGFAILVLGTKSDQLSVELIRTLQQGSFVPTDVAVFDGVGRWSLKEIASQVLPQVSHMLAVDTGLAHLAQAIGLQTTVLFGPTHPDLGFAPLSKNDRALTVNAWCSPCTKDGRSCFKFWNPRSCLEDLSPQRIAERLSEDGVFSLGGKSD
jgi:heptosyltransferase-2